MVVGVDWDCGEAAGLALLDQEEVLGAAGVAAGCDGLGLDRYCGEAAGFAPLDQDVASGVTAFGAG
jgi:hypothetical protein